MRSAARDPRDKCLRQAAVALDRYPAIGYDYFQLQPTDPHQHEGLGIYAEGDMG
jgi:hypothetical protein